MFNFYQFNREEQEEYDKFASQERKAKLKQKLAKVDEGRILKYKERVATFVKEVSIQPNFP